MDYRQLFSDTNLAAEFLDRFPEIAARQPGPGGRFEGFDDIGRSVDEAARAVRSMAEGSWSGQDAGLEAIIERFTRPVYLVRKSTFGPPPDDFPDSEEIEQRLAGARAGLEAAIPSTGRIDLRNHRMTWAGTGWLVGPTLAVTNRHVAELFARTGHQGFAFRRAFDGRQVRATVDWRRELGEPDESRFPVEDVLWIEPEGGPDMALLRLAETGESREPAPPAITLMSENELTAAGVGGWIAVIGYPARDSRNDAADQQRIFDGIYDVKRLAVGRLTGLAAGLVSHDATTLGGNSGSALIDLRTGKAAALHFGGLPGESNYAVPAPLIARMVNDHGH